jgi:hypothetical protein
MHLRHNFQSLSKKILLESRKSKELQHSKNLIFHLLKTIKGHGSPRCAHTHRLPFQMPKYSFKSSNQQPKAEHSTSTHLEGSGSQNLHKQGDIGGHKEHTFSFDILKPYLTKFIPSSQPSHIQFIFVDH